LITKIVGGVRFRVWDLAPGRANEALDCRVYAYSALCGLTHFGLQLNRRAAGSGPTPPEPAANQAIEPVPRHIANQVPPVPMAPMEPEADDPPRPVGKKSIISRLA